MPDSELIGSELDYMNNLDYMNSLGQHGTPSQQNNQQQQQLPPSQMQQQQQFINAPNRMSINSNNSPYNNPHLQQPPSMISHNQPPNSNMIGIDSSNSNNNLVPNVNNQNRFNPNLSNNQFDPRMQPQFCSPNHPPLGQNPNMNTNMYNQRLPPNNSPAAAMLNQQQQPPPPPQSFKNQLIGGPLINDFNSRLEPMGSNHLQNLQKMAHEFDEGPKLDSGSSIVNNSNNSMPPSQFDSNLMNSNSANTMMMRSNPMINNSNLNDPMNCNPVSHQMPPNASGLPIPHNQRLPPNLQPQLNNYSPMNPHQPPNSNQFHAMNPSVVDNYHMQQPGGPIPPQSQINNNNPNHLPPNSFMNQNPSMMPNANNQPPLNNARPSPMLMNSMSNSHNTNFPPTSNSVSPKLGALNNVNNNSSSPIPPQMLNGQRVINAGPSPQMMMQQNVTGQPRLPPVNYNGGGVGNNNFNKMPPNAAMVPMHQNLPPQQQSRMPLNNSINVQINNSKPSTIGYAPANRPPPMNQTGVAIQQQQQRSNLEFLQQQQQQQQQRSFQINNQPLPPHFQSNNNGMPQMPNDLNQARQMQRGPLPPPSQLMANENTMISNQQQQMYRQNGPSGLPPPQDGMPPMNNQAFNCTINQNASMPPQTFGNSNQMMMPNAQPNFGNNNGNKQQQQFYSTPNEPAYSDQASYQNFQRQMYANQSGGN